MVGNFLGAIALAGIVAEMTAIFMFDLNEVSLNGKLMIEDDQKLLFGRTFEDLDQVRRIDVLRAYGVLSPDVLEAFGRIRGTRRRHLHLAQLTDREEVARDARTMFRDAVSLVAAAIGQDIQDGKLVLNQPVVRYLESKGVISRDKDDSTAAGHSD